jgi:SEC-C motif
MIGRGVFAGSDGKGRASASARRRCSSANPTNCQPLPISASAFLLGDSLQGQTPTIRRPVGDTTACGKSGIQPRAVREPWPVCAESAPPKGCTLFAMTAKTVRPGRNEPCHCGSGRKYKLCCLEKDNAALTAANARAAADAAARPAETVPQAAKRTPKHQTEQPWKASTSRVFVPRPRGPRKVGGS